MLYGLPTSYYQSVFILYLGSYLDKFLPHAPEIVSYSDDSDIQTNLIVNVYPIEV